MRIPAILLALALVISCQTTPSDAPPEEAETVPSYRVVATGAYGTAALAEGDSARNSRLAIATAQAEYESLWRAHVGEQAPPSIDFAHESAVFLLLGQRTTGGWGVLPSSVAVEGNLAIVTAAVERPQPGGVATMALSAPFAVLAVGKPGLGEARWKEPDGRVVATAAEPPD